MSNRLLLRLRADASLVWLVLDEHGRARGPTQTGAPPREVLAQASRVIVLVPAEDVLLLDAPALSRNSAQLAKAVPFALEERLASPVEELHFALGNAGASDAIPVAVVARTTLQSWLDTLASVGVTPDVLLPETLALPLASNATMLMLDGERALLRFGATQAAATTLADLPAWLEAATPSALEVCDFRNAPRLALGPAVSAYHDHQRDALTFLATQLSPEPGPNLLQREFAPRHRDMPAQRLWRIAALLAAAALVAGFLYAAGDWWRLSRESAHLDASMRDILHASFPKFDQTAGDPYQLMQSELARLSGAGADAGALGVLSRVAPVLGRATHVTVKGIEYHNATLELALRAPDVQTLDQVREQLANLGGLKAEVTAATSASGQGDGTIEGRVRVSADKS